MHKKYIYKYIRTTHLSQMTDILSSVPLTPSGIRLKSSLPTARWAVLKGQCALPVTCRSPLHRWKCRKKKDETLRSLFVQFHRFSMYVQAWSDYHHLTRTAGSWDSLVWLGQGSEEVRWHRQPPWPSSCSSSENRLFPGLQWLALHRPQCLQVHSN